MKGYIDSKLAAWKAKQLSLAGRITIAMSVIQCLNIFLQESVGFFLFLVIVNSFFLILFTVNLSLFNFDILRYFVHF